MFQNKTIFLEKIAAEFLNIPDLIGIIKQTEGKKETVKYEMFKNEKIIGG